MLKVDLKQIDRMDGAPKADVELYEWALALIGREFPWSAWYAKKAFQEVLSERAEEKTPSPLRRRPEELTQGMLKTLSALLELLHDEDDRQRLVRLMELVARQSERSEPQAAESPSPLELLDELDEFRRKHQDARLSPADWCMRCMEAIVARAYGFSGRNKWTEALSADSSARYHRDMQDPAAKIGF